MLITLIPRKVTPKPINKEKQINSEQLTTHIFPEELDAITKLTPLNASLAQAPTLIYPGSGHDILSPLLILEKLFSKTTAYNFTFIDIDNNLLLIKNILDDLGIGFKENQNIIEFYFNKKQISLTFLQENIFTSLENLPAYDIYFERKFSIMKNQDPAYESLAFNKLKNGGILIADSGFSTTQITNHPCPQELSIYREMKIGKKEITQS